MEYLLDGEQSERLIFRKVSISDFDIWLEFYKNPITSLYWKSKKDPPQIVCQKWYETQFYRYQNNLGGMNALVEKSSKNLIGHCGLLIQTVDDIQELEIGYSLLPEFWNKGFATEAAKTCRDFAFNQNYTSHLISIISLTNKPSENVALKNGMTISKATIYANNEVNIFSINQSQWQRIINRKNQ